MRPKIADYILLELSLTLGLIYVLWPVRSVFAQCSNWMTPSYSEYATSSSDGTYVYTSVIASGTTYGACPGGCGNICPSTTHTIGALSLTPSTSSCTGYGWTYEPPEPWGSWLDWVNNQQVAAAPGTLVGFCSEGAVICSFVGQFWNTPIAYNTAASYTRIQHNYSRNPLPPRSFDKSRWLGVRFGGCTEGSLDRGPESRREEWGCGKRIRTRWVRILDIIPACAKNRSRLQPNRRYCLKSIPSPPPKCSQPWEASRWWCRRSARWACRGACSSTSGLKSARGVMTKRRSSRVS